MASQCESFATSLIAPRLGAASTRVVFIRAPAILATGDQVERLAELTTAQGEQVCVAVRQGAILATAFHPELTDDPRWHELFLSMVQASQAPPAASV